MNEAAIASYDNPYKDYPTAHDCEPGLWVELANGWIVGPIVRHSPLLMGYIYESVYVQSDLNGAEWELQVVGPGGVIRGPVIKSILVKRVGTREELFRTMSPANH